MVNEFLMYAYFGITKADPNDIILKKSAERAYLDLCRTIKFKTENEDVKKESKDKICGMLVKEYGVLLNAAESSDDKQSAFDSEHNRICEEIIKAYSEISGLTYGQAQKWLNMMLKYAILVEGDSVLKSYLHIPVDSYIMQAVGSDNPELKHCLKLECVPKRNCTFGKYSKSGSKPWSKWDYDEYTAFQNSVRTAVSEIDYNSPIEWENEAWIEVATFRK